MISLPFLTQALVLESQSSSRSAGSHGSSSTAGKQTTGTSYGPRVSASNSSFTTSYTMEPPAFVLRYSETTKESLRAGKMDVATTNQPTTHSSVCMTSSPTLTAPWLLNTSPAAATQLIVHPGGYTPPHVSSFQPYQSPMPCDHSSRMPQEISPPPLSLLPQVCPPDNRFQMKPPQPNANVSQPPTCGHARIKQYPLDLTPIPSTYRPHCLARDRLELWKPAVTRPQHSTPTPILSPKDLAQIEQTISHAWADTTKETYGTGLLAYHAFCDSRNIPDLQRAPTSSILISSFISNLAGLYSRSAVSNYVQGIRAWHTMHGLDWVVKDVEVEALLKAVASLAPPTSKCKPREPFTST